MAEANSQLRTSTVELSSSIGSLSHLAANLESSLTNVVHATQNSAEIAQRGVEIMASAAASVNQLTERAEQWPDLSSQLELSSSRVTSASEILAASADQLNQSTSGLGGAWLGLREHVEELTADSHTKLTETFLTSVEAIVQKTIHEIGSVVAGVRERDADLSMLASKVATSAEQQGIYAAKLAEVVHNMYGNMPALEDPRPTLEVMLASLKSVSDAINARSSEIGGASLNIPTEAEPQRDRADFDRSILSRIEMLVNSIQASKNVSEQSNSKLDRIAQLLEAQSKTLRANPIDSNADQSTTRKVRWPFGR